MDLSRPTLCCKRPMIDAHYNCLPKRDTNQIFFSHQIIDFYRVWWKTSRRTPRQRQNWSRDRVHKAHLIMIKPHALSVFVRDQRSQMTRITQSIIPFPFLSLYFVDLNHNNNYHTHRGWIWNRATSSLAISQTLWKCCFNIIFLLFCLLPNTVDPPKYMFNIAISFSYALYIWSP